MVTMRPRNLLGEDDNELASNASETTDSQPSSAASSKERLPSTSSGARSLKLHLPKTPILPKGRGSRSRSVGPAPRTSPPSDLFAGRRELTDNPGSEKGSSPSSVTPKTSTILGQAKQRAKSLVTCLRDNDSAAQSLSPRSSSRDNAGQGARCTNGQDVGRNDGQDVGRNVEEGPNSDKRTRPTERPRSAVTSCAVSKSPLLGHWKLEKSENWDVFLKEAGMGPLLRKISRDMTTYEDLSVRRRQWTVRIMSPLKNFESKFYLGEEFEDENFDGRRVKAVATLDESGRVLTIRQTALETEGLELLIKRQIAGDNNDRLIQTVTCNNSGVTTMRYFVRTTEEEESL